MTVADSQTARLLGQGRRLEHFTIGWNVLEAGVSVWAGIVAGSTALIGFGLDSAHIAATETPFPEKKLVALSPVWCPEYVAGLSGAKQNEGMESPSEPLLLYFRRKQGS